MNVLISFVDLRSRHMRAFCCGLLQSRQLGLEVRQIAAHVSFLKQFWLLYYQPLGHQNLIISIIEDAGEALPCTIRTWLLTRAFNFLSPASRATTGQRVRKL
jgi:hypothetical protein